MIKNIDSYDDVVYIMNHKCNVLNEHNNEFDYIYFQNLYLCVVNDIINNGDWKYILSDNIETKIITKKEKTSKN